MTKDKIDKLINDIQPHLSSLLQIECSGVQPDSPTIEALITAIKLLMGKIRIEKTYRIIFSNSKFVIESPDKEDIGLLKFEMTNGTIGTVVENFIFIDFTRLIPKPLPIQVAIILEELVHALLNVTDHSLTQLIVSSLYPCVELDTQGKYNLKKSPPQGCQF